MSIEVKDVIAASGGEIVGKIRLQKMIYLLDQLGLESGYSFDYHHYGPYSSDLASSTDIAVAFDDVAEESRRRFSDGVPYSVFKVSHAVVPTSSDRLGGLPMDKARQTLSYLQSQTGVILELAATIHWLAFVEKVGDWRKELLRRKGSKAEDGRLEKALGLLNDLDIQVV
ncbi:MAG: hypothetical protein DHS20C05_24220 [Hyphococcus sp.]|nr:MAG: hypothetical protein DHS20C05_24220 [Marinicaulis sp.]